MQKILSVLIPAHRLRKLAKLLVSDPSLSVSNSLETCDLQSLTLLDDFDEGRGFAQLIMRTGIQPRKTSAKGLDHKFPSFKEFLVHRSDLQLTTS